MPGTLSARPPLLPPHPGEAREERARRTPLMAPWARLRPERGAGHRAVAMALRGGLRRHQIDVRHLEGARKRAPGQACLGLRANPAAPGPSQRHVSVERRLVWRRRRQDGSVAARTAAATSSRPATGSTRALARPNQSVAGPMRQVTGPATSPAALVRASSRAGMTSSATSPKKRKVTCQLPAPTSRISGHEPSWRRVSSDKSTPVSASGQAAMNRRTGGGRYAPASS